MTRVLKRLAVLALCCVAPMTALRGGRQAIVDNGQAGLKPPQPHFEVVDSSPIAGVTLDDALSTLNDGQHRQLVDAVSSTLGVNLEHAGLGLGTGEVQLQNQWFDGEPFPATPNVNAKYTTFGTGDGLTIEIRWQSTGGPDGTLGSTEDGGGTGCVGVVITDREGNRSFLRMDLVGGEFIYQEFEWQQLVRDTGIVIIDGPDEVDEDVTNAWSATLADGSLPPDDGTAWGATWSGGPRCSWTAPSGDPASGSDPTFQSRFVAPGTFTLQVEVERDYTFKVLRSVPTGEEPPNAFTLEEVTMQGTIRGRSSTSGPVHDITPPELDFTFDVESGSMGIVLVSEEPLDVPPPKTCAVEIAGAPFSDTGDAPFALRSLRAADGVIRLDGSFHVHEDVRFAMRAAARDNHSPSSSLVVSWSCVDEATGATVLPEGRIERHLFRATNVPDGPSLLAVVTVADEAGNTTTVQIPILVMPRLCHTRQLFASSERCH